MLSNFLSSDQSFCSIWWNFGKVILYISSSIEVVWNKLICRRKDRDEDSWFAENRYSLSLFNLFNRFPISFTDLLFRRIWMMSLFFFSCQQLYAKSCKNRSKNNNIINSSFISILVSLKISTKIYWKSLLLLKLMTEKANSMIIWSILNR